MSKGGGRHMRIKALIRAAITVLMAWNGVAAGQAAPADTGSNFPGIKDYPLPACVKPGPRPVKPPPPAPLVNLAANNDAIAAYNTKLAEYNAAQTAYSACISDYVAGAQADLALIQSKANAGAGSNLPALKDYPSPDCGRPVQPPMTTVDTNQPADERDRAYNKQIAAYNAYVVCMNAYKARVQADTNSIQEKANGAVADSKALP